MRKVFVAALLIGACASSGSDSDDELEDGGDARDAASDGAPREAGSQDAAFADARASDASAPALSDASARDAANGSDATQANVGDGGPSDAGNAQGPGVDGGPPLVPPGTVPVFVAAGYGTRRIISCDFGLTWKNDVADVQNGGDDNTLVRGLAAGQGKFVMAIGGGGSQRLRTSDNGVDWTDTLTRTSGYNGYSDVTYGNGRFVAGGGHVSNVSTDGTTWGNEGTMGEGGILRHLGFGDYMGGRFVGVGDSGRRMNSSDGVKWGNQVQEGSTLTGVDYGNGVFVAITSSATTRYSEDGGATWKNGSVNGASGIRGILFDGQRFLATSGSATYTSTDGKTWQAAAGGTGGPSSLAVSDDRQHYVGVSANQIFHSTDGVKFTRVSQGGQDFTRVKFQRVKPSSVCPG